MNRQTNFSHLGKSAPEDWATIEALGEDLRRKRT
ncbi:hypothetical protein P3T21_006950 [Paraburkholderia sp. GAS334]|jgi:hypothetical protein